MIPEIALTSALTFTLVFGFAPGFCLRLLVKIYPRDDARRRELVAELYTLGRVERLVFVGEQLETALFEGTRSRLAARRRRLRSQPPARIESGETELDMDRQPGADDDMQAIPMGAVHSSIARSRQTARGVAFTPQELQVALLVAGGATNGETAAALFLSPNTVEFHLHNVCRKLGIRSRSELARAITYAD